MTDNISVILKILEKLIFPESWFLSTTTALEKIILKSFPILYILNCVV